MTPELKQALETIKNTCRKQKNCDDCPLNDPNGDACCTWRKEPWQWKPDEWAKKEEGENGREEIARPCEFCDGKHAVPYEKNGQMLTPYQETFRTKLFIGDLPWAGKTLFVRSYYCPTYGDSYCNGPRMDSFQINFCPHCGRDLRGDRKDGRG